MLNSVDSVSPAIPVRLVVSVLISAGQTCIRKEKSFPINCVSHHLIAASSADKTFATCRDAPPVKTRQTRNIGNVLLLLHSLLCLCKFRRNNDFCGGEQTNAMRSSTGSTDLTLQYFMPFKEGQ